MNHYPNANQTPQKKNQKKKKRKENSKHTPNSWANIATKIIVNTNVNLQEARKTSLIKIQKNE